MVRVLWLQQMLKKNDMLPEISMAAVETFNADAEDLVEGCHAPTKASGLDFQDCPMSCSK